MIEPWFPADVAPKLAFLSLFAVVSTLEYYVKQGRYRTLVISAYTTCAGLGVAFLAVAGIALLVSQPWFVVFPFAVAGAVMVPCFAHATLHARRRYTEVELRKIAAENL